MKLSALDELGMAITNAGYTWTPEMRKAYERGVREQEKEWVDLTPEEGAEIWADCHDIEWKRLVPPKEIVQRISDKLKEKNNV